MSRRLSDVPSRLEKLPTGQSSLVPGSAPQPTPEQSDQSQVLAWSEALTLHRGGGGINADCGLRIADLLRIAACGLRIIEGLRTADSLKIADLLRMRELGPRNCQ